MIVVSLDLAGDISEYRARVGEAHMVPTEIHLGMCRVDCVGCDIVSQCRSAGDCKRAGDDQIAKEFHNASWRFYRDR